MLRKITVDTKMNTCCYMMCCMHT